MKKQKKSIILSVCITLSALLVSASFLIFAASAEPGDAADPLVTKSYLESVLSEFKQDNASFELVSMTDSKKLICYEGTEFILRQGGGIIFSDSGSGMADVTGGIDLPSGISVPANHHIVCPVSQNRGIKAVGDVLVLIKGEYSIEE